MGLVDSKYARHLPSETGCNVKKSDIGEHCAHRGTSHPMTSETAYASGRLPDLTTSSYVAIDSTTLCQYNRHPGLL